MAKESGLGQNCYLDTVDVSGDVGSIDNTSKALMPIVMTDITQSAMERKAGKLSAGFSWTSYFNPTRAHPVLEDLPRTDRIITYWHRPTLGAPVAGLLAKQLGYNGNRSEDGSLLFKVEALSNTYWMDWCNALTAGKRGDTTATNGTGVDLGDPTQAPYSC